MRMRLLRFLTSLALFAPMFAVHAQSAAVPGDYPTRPIKIVVPTTAGSGSDETARSLAEHLGRRLGQSVVVENRAGAGGAIGTEFVARAPADGYTLLMGTSSTMVIAPALTARKLPYDPDGDFTAIGRVVRSPFLLLVNAKSGITNLQQFVAAAKAKAGSFSYATAGAGTTNHLLGELLAASTGTSPIHVPYKGPAPAQMDLLGGVVDFQFDTPSSAVPHVLSGKLVAIATTGDKRLDSLPQVPSFTELGYPQLRVEGWGAIYAPHGTPAAIVAQLRSALKDSTAQPEYIARLVRTGQLPDNLLGEDVTQEQKRDRDAMRTFAASRNISLN